LKFDHRQGVLNLTQFLANLIVIAKPGDGSNDTVSG
jgi:hypothetical protein